MRRKSMVSLQVFCFFLGFFSTTLKASQFSNLKVTKDVKMSSFDVKDERDFDFKIDLHKMYNLDVQSSIEKFSPKDLEKEGLTSYDFDSLRDLMTKEDRLVFRRLACLFPNRKPQDFLTRHYIEQPSSRMLLKYDKFEGETKNGLKFYKKTQGRDLHFRLRIAEYDVSSATSSNMRKEDVDKLLSLAPQVMGAKLEKIVKTFSKASDVVDKTEEKDSYPSYGGSTVYFYYSVPGGHTLQVSLKVMSFKKASFNRALWDALKLGVVLNEKGKVRESVEKFRAVVYR